MRSRRESNPHLRFRKPPFYPLNYGNKLPIFVACVTDLCNPMCPAMKNDGLARRAKFSRTSTVRLDITVARKDRVCC
jgi:hypothetical protein